MWAIYYLLFNIHTGNMIKEGTLRLYHTYGWPDVNIEQFNKICPFYNGLSTAFRTQCIYTPGSTNTCTGDCEGTILSVEQRVRE